MKKIIALALSLMMLLGCVSALAEAAEKEILTVVGAFEIKYNPLPEYYTLDADENTDLDYTALILPQSEDKPMMILNIAFSDEWDGVNTLADATEEDIAAVKADFYEEAELNEGDLSFTDMETAHGTPVLVVREIDGTLASVYTIYLSHEIEIVLFGSDDAPITDADVDAVLAFLSDVDFVPLEK